MIRLDDLSTMFTWQHELHPQLQTLIETLRLFSVALLLFEKAAFNLVKGLLISQARE